MELHVLVLRLMILASGLLGTEAQKTTTKKPSPNVTKEDAVEYLYKYRVVNWCVTGNNEPALFEWPLVQFRPFLIRTDRFQSPKDFVEVKDEKLKTGDDLKDYEEHVLKNIPKDISVTAELSFKKIWCDGFAFFDKETDLPEVYDQNVGPKQSTGYKNPNTVSGSDEYPFKYQPIVPIGHHKIKDPEVDPGTNNADELYYKYIEEDGKPPGDKVLKSHHFHQRVHIELKLSNPNPGKESDFFGVEGILIQANHAPFGMGFPFGQFYRGEDTEDGWPCKCDKNIHRIIPCLSRPDVEILAPTIAAFHYQMHNYTIKDSSQNYHYPKRKTQIGRQKEFHFNFKWNSHPCSSANLVEFFVLIVYDFYRRRYEIKKFGPYDFSPMTFENADYEKFGVKAGDRNQYEAKEDRLNNLKWYMPLSEPKTTTTTLPRFQTDLIPPPNPPPAPTPPGQYQARPGFVQNPLFMPSPIFPHCRVKPKIPHFECEVDDKPHVSPTPALPWTNQCDDEYYMSCHDTPYVFPSVKSIKKLWAERNYDADYFPWEVRPKQTPARTSDPTNSPSWRFNGEFDINCLTNYPREKEAYRQCANWTGRYQCDKKYANSGNKHTYLKIIQTNIRMQTNITIKTGRKKKDQFFHNTFCEPCKYVPTTANPKDKNETEPLFKRTPHSACMLVAFIYMIPMSNLIARHYKETLNTCEASGYRLWLWLHIFISIFAMMLAYAGYNLPTFWLLDKHMWYGYAAMFCGGAGVITGWGRHKMKWARWLMFVIHSVPSHAAVIFAGASYFKTSTSFLSSWLMVGGLCVMLVVMLTMDCCVWCDDRRVGMYPRRGHIPILQVRFEDAIDHAQRSRWIFLIVFSVLYAAPVTAMMFV